MVSAQEVTAAPRDARPSLGFFSSFSEVDCLLLSSLHPVLPVTLGLSILTCLVWSSNHVPQRTVTSTRMGTGSERGVPDLTPTPACLVG